MAQGPSYATGRTLPDYLRIAANVIYAVAGLVFLAGLFVDWKFPGVAVFLPLQIATNPANSGLFLLSIVLLAVGFAFGRTALTVEGWQAEAVEQEQEYTVDVGGET